MGQQGRTSITLQEDTKEPLRQLKEASSASTWDEFMHGLINDAEEVEVRLDDLETVEFEKTEKAKETRAMVVGVVEAMQRTGIKEDVMDLIEELRKAEMMEMNKEIVQQVLEKSQTGEPLNEADRALLKVVIEIESTRSDKADAATAIAESLFGETDESTAETTTHGKVEDADGVSLGLSGDDLDAGPGFSMDDHLPAEDNESE